MSVSDEIFNQAFFSTDDFAEEVELTPVGGTPSAVNVIFLSEYESANLPELGNEARQPMAQAQTSMLEGIGHGAKLVRPGKGRHEYSEVYFVTGVQHDGDGITTLMLSKNRPS